MAQEIQKIIADYALSSRDNLETAYETRNAFPMILNSVSNEFVKILIEKVNEYDLKTKWLIEETTNNERINVYFFKESWPSGTKIGFLDYDSDRLFLSVQSSEENHESLYLKIKETNSGQINSYRYWTRLRMPYNRWNESIEGILAMTKYGDLNSTLNYFINLIISHSIIIDDFLAN